MHRVELKVRDLKKEQRQLYEVPNAPCGVERKEKHFSNEGAEKVMGS